ncbi:hypothetical protein V8E53_006009 [Lactarius tabidus]
MSPNRVPPPFPLPFDSTSTTNPPPYTTSTPEQRSIVPGQGSVYPPETHGPGGTPNVGPPMIPPRQQYPSAYPPSSQPIQGSVHARPTFPIPQIPHPLVPTTSGPPPLPPPPPPPPPMVQWGDPTRMPSHLPSHNTPVAPGSHSGPHLQAPLMMSHSLSQHDGMSGAAHIYPRVPRTQVDSNNEGHVVGQSFPETPHHDRRAKGPPNPVAAGVRKCRRCNRPCPPGYAYCSASCQSAR